MKDKISLKPKRFKMVRVEWDDTMTQAGWGNLEDYRTIWNTPNRTLHYSCGFLVESSHRFIILIQSYGASTNLITDSLQIPRRSVQKVTYLKEVSDG